MDHLGTIANVAEIVGAAIVIGGVAFAVIQIRDFRRQRLDIATIELVRTFANPELNRALRLVQGLPNNFSLRDASQFEPNIQDAILLVSATYESLGVLVYRGVVSLDLVYDLMGGAVETSWARIETFAKQLRVAVSRPKTYEFFEWLAERLVEHGHSGVRPAYRRQ